MPQSFQDLRRRRLGVRQRAAALQGLRLCDEKLCGTGQHAGSPGENHVFIHKNGRHWFGYLSFQKLK